MIDWERIETTLAAHFVSERGLPSLPPRLVAGLLYLQIKLPIDPSSLTLWRKRIGEEGVETLLLITINVARRGDILKASSLDKIIVDTTIMPKAIAHPTDSRLLEKSRQHLVKLADENGIELRQNYNREAPRLAAQVGRYAYARQYKRMKKRSRRCAQGLAECTVKSTASWANCQSISDPKRKIYWQGFNAS